MVLDKIFKEYYQHRKARIIFPAGCLAAGVLGGFTLRPTSQAGSSVDPMNPFLDPWCHSLQGKVDLGLLPDPAILTQSGASIGRHGVLYFPQIHTPFPVFTGTKPWSPGSSLQQGHDLSCGTPDYADFLTQYQKLSGSTQSPADLNVLPGPQKALILPVLISYGPEEEPIVSSPTHKDLEKANAMLRMSANILARVTHGNVRTYPMGATSYHVHTTFDPADLLQRDRDEEGRYQKFYEYEGIFWKPLMIELCEKLSIEHNKEENYFELAYKVIPKLKTLIPDIASACIALFFPYKTSIDSFSGYAYFFSGMINMFYLNSVILSHEVLHAIFGCPDLIPENIGEKYGGVDTYEVTQEDVERAKEERSLMSYANPIAANTFLIPATWVVMFGKQHSSVGGVAAQRLYTTTALRPEQITCSLKEDRSDPTYNLQFHLDRTDYKRYFVERENYVPVTLQICLRDEETQKLIPISEYRRGTVGGNAWSITLPPGLDRSYQLVVVSETKVVSDAVTIPSKTSDTTDKPPNFTFTTEPEFDLSRSAKNTMQLQFNGTPLPDDSYECSVVFIPEAVNDTFSQFTRDSRAHIRGLLDPAQRWIPVKDSSISLNWEHLAIPGEYTVAIMLRNKGTEELIGLHTHSVTAQFPHVYLPVVTSST